MIQDIIFQHLNNFEFVCKGDCQKVWWCEGGKLQTDICQPLEDGTEPCNNISLNTVLSRTVFV